MNEQAGNIEYEFLWKLLANPADPTHSYIFDLQSLVNDFPQSGILRALLIPNGDKRNLKHATVYCDPVILHKLATAPGSLPFVSEEQVVQSDEPLPVPADTYYNFHIAEPFTPPVEEETVTEHLPVTDTVSEEETVAEDEAVAEEEIPPVQHHEELPDVQHQEEAVAEYAPVAAEIVAEENTAPPQYAEEIPIIDTIAEQEKIIAAYLGDDAETGEFTAPENAVDKADEIIAEQPVTEPVPVQEDAAPLMTELSSEEKEETHHAPVTEDNSLAKEYDEYVAKTTDTETAEEAVYSFDDKVEYFQHDIDDEIYDEIVSIEDIGLEQLAVMNRSGIKADDDAHTENVKESDYFIFEPEIANINTEPVENKQAVIAEAKYDPQNEPVNNDVSRYNDEKMPYTFIWWLDKTRKEHDDTYQPYINTPTKSTAKPKKKKETNELQQQYYENIVSTNSINELDQDQGPQTGTTSSNRKEDKIIERFILQEPQIKHPGTIKLDSENKAKKSSEDRDELVTETLARIYTEQMLYNKAVATYKKLMLKYPEKSLYFAGQIEQLENKLN